MPDVMKTLLLNPPSFENFDGGASSRWPVSREIESYWYPVWLSYPTGLISGARLLDASPHKVSKEQTIQIAKDYEFIVVFTSTVGFESDVELIRGMKALNRDLKICFVGPHVQNKPDESLHASEDIDFVVRGEIDFAVKEFAEGHALEDILGVSYRKNGRIVHNGARPQLHTEELDSLPYAVDVFKENVDIEKYTGAVPAAPVRFDLHDARLSGAVHFLPVAADDLGPRMAGALHGKCGAGNCARAGTFSKAQGIFLR